MTDQNETIYHICEYLNSLKDESKGNGDDIDTILSLMEQSFNVSISSENFSKYSVAPVTLSEMINESKKTLNLKNYETALKEAKENPKFDPFVDAVVKRGYFDGVEEGSVEYMLRYSKLLSKFHDKVDKTPVQPSKAELEKQAEEFKVKGNTAINSKDFETAIKYYDEALKLSSDGPNSHVYYSNRAAAYCHLNNYQSAVDDCLSCLALSPDYVKAYSRLGLAYFFLEKYQDAVDAYERALEIEPDNKQTVDSLKQAKNKLKKKSTTASSSSVAANDGPSMPSGPGGAGLPGGMSGLMNNPSMKKAMDQVGGPAGLSNLMKDPQMMAMAQQMMKDPNMMKQAMSMLGGAGGAGGGGGMGGGDGGGMPDFSALASMMGGMGMGGPGSQDPPSSSSQAPSSSSKKKFKGFEE
jgi:small glutamine-rich tetratricopeptide repeat-containing protein alpha